MKPGWIQKPLGDLCRIELGKTPPRKFAEFWDEQRATGNVWVSIADMPIGIHSRISDSKEYVSDAGAKLGKTVPKDTLLVSFKLTLGRLAYAGCDLQTNEAIAALYLHDETVIDKAYLYWYLTYFDWDKAAEGDEKVKGKTLNKDKLKRLPVIVPPLAEQRRIVAVLDEAFARIATVTANAEKNLANAHALFTSAVAEVFTRKGVQWMSLPLGKVAEFVDYRGKTPPKTPTGTRLITAKNVKMGFVQRQPEEFVDPTIYDGWMTRGIPQCGDVLFTTEAPLGNVAQLDTDNKVIIGQRLITLQTNPSQLNPTFLRYMLTSEPLQKEIHSRATGATVLGIKAKLLKEVPTYFPPDITEQTAIADRLSRLEDTTRALAKSYVARLSEQTNLRRAILDAAFSGNLADFQQAAAA
ncbi:restriction endonuclease subunit S [Erythrobacter litoralis]|uniref:restriction endonuclease subunit S n=1 Tax=Erythrobacter litoralis TaxID=39960 RepID=UPI002435C737|nr:restriction endonuclease subunit S [Erythrobacter litoralis]MDG6079724.1 restriction endonuclease subunit S [Erythrobacter litoralis]